MRGEDTMPSPSRRVDRTSPLVKSTANCHALDSKATTRLFLRHPPSWGFHRGSEGRNSRFFEAAQLADRGEEDLLTGR